MAIANVTVAEIPNSIMEAVIPLLPLVEAPETVSGMGDNTEEVLWMIIGMTTLMWSAWAMGHIVEKFGGPALVGEIFVGMLFGPNGIPLLPKYMRVVGGPLDIIGTTGLLILVYEGGLTTDLRMFKTHGAQVISLAFTGIIMPVVFAIPVMSAFGFSFLESFTAGTVLCSTAIAFTVRLLSDNNMLKTHKGQLIIISAVIDDIMSLVVLAVLNVIGQHHFDLSKILWPLWTSALVFIAALSLKFVLGKLVEDCGEHCLSKYTTGWSVPLFTSVVTLFVLLCTYGTQRIGSTYLLGTYMAGIVLSAIPTAEDAWEISVGDAIRPWFGRLFFTATVGFAIPLNALVDPHNILCGFVLTLAAIAGKFLTGLWASKPGTPGYFIMFLQVGAAMVGRGELGFVVAKMALAMGLLHEESFSACIWALLVATILGPFMFQFFLRWDKEQVKDQNAEKINSYKSLNSNGVNGESNGLYQAKTVYTSVEQAPIPVEPLADI